jgi:CarD family transcriptional regulator
MYEINDLIMYGREGVCRVDDICTLNITGTDKNRLYYILDPLYKQGKIYTPIDTKIYMRPIISSEEALQLIDGIPSVETNVCNERLKTLEDQYKAELNTHQCEDLIRLIKTVGVKKDESASKGKKLGKTDENYMKMAEETLYGEFAQALKIPRENVKVYIEERIKTFEH